MSCKRVGQSFSDPLCFLFFLLQLILPLGPGLPQGLRPNCLDCTHKSSLLKASCFPSSRKLLSWSSDSSSGAWKIILFSPAWTWKTLKIWPLAYHPPFTHHCLYPLTIGTSAKLIEKTLSLHANSTLQTNGMKGPETFFLNPCQAWVIHPTTIPLKHWSWGSFGLPDVPQSSRNWNEHLLCLFNTSSMPPAIPD